MVKHDGMSKDYRVLVTGSRKLDTPSLVYRALDELAAFASQRGYTCLVLVHGASTGADLYAERWTMFPRADDLTVISEPHPADWKTGRKAGPVRNQVMIDAGADIVLAFPVARSRGTYDCVRRAVKAGIPVRFYGIAV